LFLAQAGVVVVEHIVDCWVQRMEEAVIAAVVAAAVVGIVVVGTVVVVDYNFEIE
jgi:hypothetical protein